MEAGRHSHLDVACFLPQPLRFGESPPFLWDDGSSGFQSNLPPLRLTKVGRQLSQGLPAITSSCFIPEWEYVVSKDHLVKSSRESMGRLFRNFYCFPDSCSFPAWVFSSLRPFFLVKLGLVFFFTIRNF